MKLLLFGSTGFIGSQVLISALSNTAITSITAFSRRELPDAATHSKLTVIIVNDFLLYTEEMMEHLRNADAVIWSMGTYTWDPLVELSYPSAFHLALASLSNIPPRKLRYIYLGGAFTVPDQSKSLWFLSKGRHMRGLAQTNLITFTSLPSNKQIMPYIVRPAGVVPRKNDRSWGMSCAVGLVDLGPVPTVDVDVLAGVMVDLAVHGGGEVSGVEKGSEVKNAEILERGRKLVGR